MSQRNLECTVCSGSHSRLHCTFICKSCGGDYCQCECETVNRQSRPNKRIHSRYDKVLQTMKDNNCSMANAYRLSGCPRSTLRDFIAIAELKKVDSRAFEIALASYQGESVRELEKSLGRYMPLMSNCCLLNLTSAFTSEVPLTAKTAPLGATTFSKVNGQ